MKKKEKRKEEIPWPKPGTVETSTTFAQPTSDHLTSLLSSIITIIIFIVTAKWDTYKTSSHSNRPTIEAANSNRHTTFFRLKGSMKVVVDVARDMNDDTFDITRKKTFFAGPEQAYIYHQFYFLHVVVIVNLDTDISHFEMYFARRFDMMANNKWGKFSMVELAVDSRSSYSAATLHAEGGKRARFVREKPENWRTCRKTRNNSLTTVQCLNKRSKLATWNECFFFPSSRIHQNRPTDDSNKLELDSLWLWTEMEKNERRQRCAAASRQTIEKYLFKDQVEEQKLGERQQYGLAGLCVVFFWGLETLEQKQISKKWKSLEFNFQ